MLAVTLIQLEINDIFSALDSCAVQTRVSIASFLDQGELFLIENGVGLINAALFDFRVIYPPFAPIIETLPLARHVGVMLVVLHFPEFLRGQFGILGFGFPERSILGLDLPSFDF